MDELWIIEDDSLFTEFQKMSLTGQRCAHQSPRNPEAETGDFATSLRSARAIQRALVSKQKEGKGEERKGRKKTEDWRR